MTAAWLRLLTRYPNQRGPTVPFVVGALRQPPGTRVADPQACKRELRALLAEMRDHMPDDQQITIRRCPNLQQPIVELEHRHPSVSSLIRLASPMDANRALWCEPIYGSPIDDIDSLVVALWQSHGQVICDGHFSCDRETKQWRPFNEAEVSQIRAALAKDGAGA